MDKNLLVLALLLCAPGVATAAQVPACAGPVEISRAHAVRVEQNGVLVLADGRALTLEGIRLPLGAAEHAPARLADEARATLLSLANEAPLSGRAVPPKEDRYDRVRVQAFVGPQSSDSKWLQQALLEQGLARVAITPDRSECAAQLYGFEATARKAGTGLWALSAYRIRTTNDDWRPDIGTFQLIEGRLTRVTAQGGDTVLDFGGDGKTGLLAAISEADRHAFRNFDFDSLTGRRLRLRGIVQDSGGRPMLALSAPGQIEVLN
jgi:endonuclease YncB( thermonuclease family)